MGLVAFFLILMVVMGLIGVLWQHVTRRTIELGVRRAKGATKAAIYSQILGEFLVVATLAILLGLICLIQLPMIGILKPQAYNVFIPSFFLSALVLYSLTLISAWYPSWMAGRIPPAEALHYE
jgi:putative ABC transport system permease protein